MRSETTVFMSGQGNDWRLIQAVRNALRRRGTRLRVALSTSLAFTASIGVMPVRAELPVICVSGATCGNSTSVINNPLTGATLSSSGNTMTVNQTASSAVLQWQSFNISSGSTVNFVQPGSDSVALNRIYQNSASQIMGNLNANGRVYLINQNGFLFGNGAVVNVSGLIASSLNISSYALNEDGSTNLTAAASSGQAAFQLFTDAAGNVLASGNVTVGQGATITTSEGGQVFMFAPNVYNEGTISTPGGQTVLAAGDSVYLAESTDENLRGIWVEVGTGGTVQNGAKSNDSITDKTQLVGQIIAERGNVTLAGAAVNQYGRITATTSVNEGGSIRLVARDGGYVANAIDPATLSATTGGTLILGENSVTEVQLDDNGETAVDDNKQPVSQVVLIGEKIILESNAQIVAPHGEVTLAACSNCQYIKDISLEATASDMEESITSNSEDEARIYLADGALIDVSGVNIQKSMESNVIAVELRGDELADSELQRDGALRGETVYIDIRDSGTREDGTEWVGSPIGDLSGWVEGIEKTVDERSLTGGTVKLLSRGDVLLDKGSTIDISGGSITYADGYINTSKVLGTDGKLYDIAEADPDREYRGVVSSGTYTITDERWGVTRTYAGASGRGTYEQGYVEGKDAGTVQVLGQKVVMDGTIKAETQTGRYQRQLSSDLDANASALYRPYDELALSGTLIIGKTSASGDAPDYVIQDVKITSDSTPQLAADFNPLTDALNGIGNTVVLNSNLFGEDRIGNLTLRANNTVTVEQGTDVSLSAGGTINIRANAIDVAGSITSHGGDIRLTAAQTISGGQDLSGIHLRSGARLDTSGQWVNDSSLVNGGTAGTAPLAIDGGSVNLNADGGSLVLESGSVIDVSGGAQYTRDGKLVSGSAGSIGLSNSQPANLNLSSTVLTLDGELRAYGFESGGTLALSTSGVCIADTAASCEQGDATTLWLKPEFFRSGGFSDYAITSNLGGIEVAAGTTVKLQQNNWILRSTTDASRIATGTSLSDIADVGWLRDVDRQAVDLSLTATPARRGGVYDSTTFANAESLIIGTGASIEGDVGASISLTSSSRLLVDGTVSAAAGSIALQLSNSLSLSTGVGADVYFEDQGIWLGENARLLARGAAVTETDDQGRVTGEVLDGGTITLDADRGHVITSSGSLIDVSGTAATLSVKSDAQGHYRTSQVGSAGGTLNIEAAEAIVIGGDIQGQSGDPGNLAGGTLRVSLDTSKRNDPTITTGNNQFLSKLPGGDRTIEVTQQAVNVSFADSTLPDSYQGKAVVAADQVTAGGFDALELNAVTTWTTEASSTPNTVHVGRIEFDGDVSLSLARSLTLNAAVIASNGGDASLQASIVTLGNSAIDLNADQYQASVQAGSGTLQVNAQQIDVVGTSVLQGFADATLQSSGDLRLVGVKVDPQGSNATASLEGSLSTAGDLTLSAAQVYPTTLTQFTVSAGEGTQDGTLRITQNGTAGDALSAGGALTLTAPNVVQSGTVRAPFGSITIDSPTITLTDGSVTSTSGAGLSVLYGETEGGLDWVYVIGSDKIVYGDGNEQLVSQHIELNGDTVELQEGATLDVSGGGDLIATEFVSGTGGTQDILGDDNSAGSFAIVPVSSIQSSAYDYSIWEEAGFSGGKSIYLSGTDGVPAGEYIILPAKYALLPGAYLVTPVSGYQDITAGESYQQTDGSVVVSGYYTYTGSGLRDSARTSGFAVLKGDDVQQKAEYTLTHADQYFADSTAAQRLPKDAGTVSIVANNALVLDGNLDADAAEGGRGAALDIASSTIAVVADAGTDTAEGVLTLDADDLNAMGAESILLGGTRSSDEEGIVIDVSADNVTVAEGAALEAPEVILAATGTVAVEQGASITASGAEVQADQISVSGDGALLRVATSAAATVERTGAENDSGVVSIAAGATLTATGGSISLESSGTAELQGVLSAEDGEVSLTGNNISLGNADAAVTGWVLDAAQLSSLNAATLTLNSRGAIDWYGDVSLDLTNLNLNAQTLRGYDNGQIAINAAGEVSFTGGEGESVLPASTASGNISIAATNVNFAGGTIEMSGFDTVTLTAEQELRADESSVLSVDGNLDLSAQRITTGSGVDFEINAEGAATLATSGSTETLAAVNDLGGSFNLTAAAIDVGTQIILPSGIVTLTATDTTNGGITLTEGAVIDVSGRATVFDDESVYSSGGSVTLATASGDLVLSEGSNIDVSAEGGAAAGSISLSAVAGNLSVAGELRGSADQAVDSGSFSADAQNLGDFTALNASLQTSGFGGDLSFRQRGSGDLTVASDDTVQGTSVSITADQGSITVAGEIHAHDEDGGRIELAAHDGMTVSGTLDARATSSEERNGRISLSVSDGGLNVTDSAVIATTSSEAAEGSSGDGEVSIRLDQDYLLTVIDADGTNDAVQLGGDWSNAGDVSIEGFKVYMDEDGVLDSTETSADTSAYYADAATFAAQTDLIAAALSNASIVSLDVVTGVEIQSETGSLTLDADWNLADWRFVDSTGAQTSAGVLTLRAEDDLTFNQSLSDGFSSADDFTLDLGFGDSWSYNLVAGADTSSADVMATRSMLENTQNTGSVTIVGGADSSDSANYTVVRTGTGSIDVAAALDIVLINDAAMIYTAGEASDGTIYSSTQRNQDKQLGGLYYPTNGGDITITAGRDVIGAVSDQAVTDWLWRVGDSESDSAAWTVNFASFHQGVGALGGGDVTVTAGRNVEDLSVSTPSVSDGSIDDSADDELKVIGGGNVVVKAGGDILGGMYYSGVGEIELTAEGSVGDSSETGESPVLALGDTQATVTARQDLEIAAVVTPTLLPQGMSQSTGIYVESDFDDDDRIDSYAIHNNTESAFSTYTENSSVSLVSTAGDVALGTETTTLQTLTNMDIAAGQENLRTLAFSLLPSTVSVLALRGDAEVSGTLSPSETGHLEVRAYDDVNLDNVIVSDVDPAEIPTADRPVSSSSITGTLITDLTQWKNNENDSFNADTPVRLEAAEAGTLSSSLIVSATGDVTGSGYFGGPVDIYAGDDVVNLDVVIQNLVASDVSSITADGDILYTTSRSASGGITPDDGIGIIVDGPGQLLLVAGGDIDLGTSGGVTSRGDQENAALANEGASITALAGLNGEDPNYAAFTTKYLEEDDTYTSALQDYLKELTGSRPASREAALEAFAELDEQQRGTFLYRVLLAEVRASAEEAASEENQGDYSRGFAALETLFPGSTGDDNPYAGNIDLYFSRIYTLDGGDITLLTPGGEVNAGLAAAPESFGIRKDPDELGIVTRNGGNIGIVTDGDVQVNESRIFAINDSDIVVWSSNGDIDAGRGAKTAALAPTLSVVYDNDGHATLTYDAALSGSGIQTRATTEDHEAGDVVLAAPRGVVNAGDAGIVAGNLTIAATAVLGADNIKVSGVSVGVPVDTGGLGASLAGVTSAASGAANSATALMSDDTAATQQAAPMATAALSWLEVFVVGLGEDTCRQDDLECLKRQTQAKQE